MLIASDIQRLKVSEKSHRGMTRVFESYEVSPKGDPLYVLELLVEHEKSELKIQKHERIRNAWIYKTKFDGKLNGPNDLYILLGWLGISLT